MKVKIEDRGNGTARYRVVQPPHYEGDISTKGTDGLTQQDRWAILKPGIEADILRQMNLEEA